MSHDIKYLINKRFLLRNDRFRYLRMQRKHFNLHHRDWWFFEERSNFGFVLRSVGIWDMLESFPRSFHIWWVILKDERHSEHKQICSFFTTLDWKSAWSETCIFFSSSRTAMYMYRSFQHVQKVITSKDVMLMSVPCVWCTWQITVYFMHSMTQCILWLSDQLPVEFNCRQLLKVPDDRRKNGSLRKYH